MELVKLKLGDKAWCYLGNHKGKMTEGKVVHVFQLDWGTEQYVIEIDTHIEPVLEVRDGLSCSDSPNKPIGFLRRMSMESATRFVSV